MDKKAYSVDDILDILTESMNTFCLIGSMDVVDENNDLVKDETVHLINGNLHCIKGLVDYAREEVRDMIEYGTLTSLAGTDEDDEDGEIYDE